MRHNGAYNSTAAVVVTYNRIHLLKQCLEHLDKQTCPCDVLVVNNASTDGTGEWLESVAQSRTNLRVQTLPANIGGAGGFNYGVRWAVEAGYHRLWLMDDDTLPQPDALEKLQEADEILEGNYGWLSSVALWTDGSECKMNRQKLKKSFYEYSHLLRHGLVQAEQATFVSLYIRRETVLRFGLPIQEFFIWGDDIEFTRRIAVRGGVPSFVAGQSQVMHAMDQNCGSSIATDTPERISRYNFAFRNENFLYRQEGAKGFAYYTAKCCLNAFRVITKARDHRLARLWILVRQYIFGFFFHPPIESV